MLYYVQLRYNTDIKNLPSSRSLTDGQVYSTKGCNSFYFVKKAYKYPYKQHFRYPSKLFEHKKVLYGTIMPTG
jgi:hypothetical protein